MARWVPDDRDGLDDLIRDLVEMFTGAERRIIAALAVQARAGLAKGEGPLKALRLGELRRDSQGIAQALRDAYPDEVARIAATASEWGTDAAIKEMSALADVEDLTKTARVAGSPAAQAMTADLTNALDDVTKRILRYPDDVYRQTVANNALNVTLGQATGKQAQQGAWNQLLDQRVTGFTDKAGRDWNLSSYTEMSTRTATRRAWDDAKVSAMHENGIDLVSVVVGSGSCKLCARWAGKILRTNGGPTGRIKLQHATEGREVTVTVAGTLARAKSDGWRHPNCRCSTTAYLPGLSVITDVTTYDPEKEQERMRLRALERGVRANKLKATSSLTDDGRTKATAKARDMQTKIREHVATTGLKRQRGREQIDLDNRRA